MKQLKWNAPDQFELMLQYRFWREFPRDHVDITPELRKEAEGNPRIDLQESREYFFDFSEYSASFLNSGVIDTRNYIKAADPRHPTIKALRTDHWNGYYFVGYFDKHAYSYAKYVENYYKTRAREIWDIKPRASVGLDLIIQTHYGNVIWDFPKTVRRPLKAKLIPRFYWETLIQPPYDGT